MPLVRTGLNVQRKRPGYDLNRQLVTGETVGARLWVPGAPAEDCLCSLCRAARPEAGCSYRLYALVASGGLVNPACSSSVLGSLIGENGWVRLFGEHEQRVIDQLERCAGVEPGALAVLCADGHLGYSHPIGGAAAYREHISPSGVGYDIGCGNKAVRTDIRVDDLGDVASVMDEIYARMGRRNDEPVDHPVFDEIRAATFAPQRALLDLAARQLGTVGRATITSTCSPVTTVTNRAAPRWVLAFPLRLRMCSTSPVSERTARIG